MLKKCDNVYCVLLKSNFFVEAQVDPSTEHRESRDAKRFQSAGQELPKTSHSSLYITLYSSPGSPDHKNFIKLMPRSNCPFPRASPSDGRPLTPERKPADESFHSSAATGLKQEVKNIAIVSKMKSLFAKRCKSSLCVAYSYFDCPPCLAFHMVLNIQPLKITSSSICGKLKHPKSLIIFHSLGFILQQWMSTVAHRSYSILFNSFSLHKDFD